MNCIQVSSLVQKTQLLDMKNTICSLMSLYDVIDRNRKNNNVEDNVALYEEINSTLRKLKEINTGIAKAYSSVPT